MANSSHNIIANTTWSNTTAATNSSSSNNNTTLLIGNNSRKNDNMTYNKNDAGYYSVPMEMILTLYALIFLVALVGNLVVVLIVVLKKRMQTFTNWLILNLAIADLFVALVCIPLEIPLEINERVWIYGKVFCSVFYPIQTSAIYGSVFTLVGLSFSRYWAIIHPFRKQPGSYAAKILIAVIWTCSLVVVVPYMTVLKYSDNNCGEKWTGTQKRTYTVAVFTFQYVLPIIVMLVAYTLIIYELCHKKKGDMSKMDKQKYKETKRVVRLLVVITTTFAICVLPYHVLFIFSEFGGKLEYFNDVLLASYFLLYMNSALNPILYNVFNERFRKSFKQVYNRVISCVTSQKELFQDSFFASRRSSRYFEEEYKTNSNTQDLTQKRRSVKCDEISTTKTDEDTIQMETHSSIASTNNNSQKRHSTKIEVVQDGQKVVVHVNKNADPIEPVKFTQTEDKQVKNQSS